MLSLVVVLTDRVLRAFGDYLDRHILEETGHDEWILDDAEVLGIDRKLLLERIPKQTAAQIVGSQYYWMYHYHPVSMLGLHRRDGRHSAKAEFN